MTINENATVDVLSDWNNLLKREIINLPEIQLSPLSSWVKDCEDSFKEVYSNLLVKIVNSTPDDYETIHDSVVDIYWHLDHIKKHIVDAEDGFMYLMKILASKIRKETE